MGGAVGGEEGSVVGNGMRRSGGDEPRAYKKNHNEYCKHKRRVNPGIEALGEERDRFPKFHTGISGQIFFTYYFIFQLVFNYSLFWAVSTFRLPSLLNFPLIVPGLGSAKNV